MRWNLVAGYCLIPILGCLACESLHNHSLIASSATRFGMQWVSILMGVALHLDVNLRKS
ncbi:hypothetical protein Hdeb2414_s0088g00786321 [Helianthus debilis subsp. tardiflorus]